MGILQTIGSRLARLGRQQQSKAATVTVEELFNEWAITNGATKAGVVVNHMTALQTAVVLACVRLISEGIAQVPFKVMRDNKGRKEPARDLPLYDLLTVAPNEWMTSFELRETMAMHAVLTGNAYAFKVMSGPRVVELLLLDPSTVMVDRKGFDLRYKVLFPDGKTMDAGPELIWHWKGPSWNSWSGLDATRLIREAIGLSVAAEEMSSKMFANGGRLSGVLSTPAVMTQEMLAKLRDDWLRNYGGSGNAGKTAILHGDWKWQSLSMSAADTQLMQARNAQIEEICRGFRVNPVLIGYTDKAATYASVEQQMLAHVKHTLAPWHTRIEQCADMQLLTKADRKAGTYTKFYTQGLMRGAMADRVAYYSSMFAIGAISPNEVRELEDMNPYEEGDDYRVPMNLVIPGQEQPPEAAAPPGMGPPSPDEPEGSSAAPEVAAQPGKSFGSPSKAGWEEQPRDDNGRWTGGFHEPRPEGERDGPIGPRHELPPLPTESSQRERLHREVEAFTAATGAQVALGGNGRWDDEMARLLHHIGPDLQTLVEDHGIDLSAMKVSRERPEGSAFGDYNFATKEVRFIEREHMDVRLRAENPIYNNVTGGCFNACASEGAPAGIRHEVGHYVDSLVSRGLGSEEFVYATFELTGGRRTSNEEFNNLASQVSEYAKTGPRELFAEAFTYYTSPNYVPGRLPAVVEKVVSQAVAAVSRESLRRPKSMQQILERIALLVESKYSEDQPRDEGGRWTDGGSAELIDEQMASEGMDLKLALLEAPRSTVHLLQKSRDEALRALGLQSKMNAKGKVLTRDVAEALQADTLAITGGIANDDTSDEARDNMADALAHEVAYQFANDFGDTPSGVGWYSKDYPDAVRALGERFPELADKTFAGSNSRAAFDMLVAVTSNGEKPAENIAKAIAYYEQWRLGHDMTSADAGARRGSDILDKVARIAALEERLGSMDAVRDRLLQPILVKDLNVELRAMGQEVSGDYSVDTVVPRATAYFGAKMGAFYANLSGQDGYLTMDQWWSRSMNRMRGDLVPGATDEQFNSFREKIGAVGASREATWAEISRHQGNYSERNWQTELEILAREYEPVDKKGRAKEPRYKEESQAWRDRARARLGDKLYEELEFRHDAEKAANTIYKSEVELINEAPFRASDRSFQIRVAQQAQTVLAGAGINISIADLQAAEWYYEQKLYSHLTGRPRGGVGFSQAIRNAARKT